MEDMWSNVVMPDAFTYGSVIAVCERSGRWQEAVELVLAMRRTRGEFIYASFFLGGWGGGGGKGGGGRVSFPSFFLGGWAEVVEGAKVVAPSGDG